MEEIFENPILKEFYEVRRNALETTILKEQGKENTINIEKTQEILSNEIRKLEINNEVKFRITEQIEQFENALNEESDLLSRNFYKIGFIDAISLIKEVKDNLEKFKKI